MRCQFAGLLFRYRKSKLAIFFPPSKNDLGMYMNLSRSAYPTKDGASFFDQLTVSKWSSISGIPWILFAAMIPNLTNSEFVQMGGGSTSNYVEVGK